MYYLMLFVISVRRWLDVVVALHCLRAIIFSFFIFVVVVVVALVHSLFLAHSSLFCSHQFLHVF